MPRKTEKGGNAVNIDIVDVQKIVDKPQKSAEYSLEYKTSTIRGPVQ